MVDYNSPMKIVMGLGNPGVEYSVTRHNSGVMLVDAIYNLKFEIYKYLYWWRRKKNIFVAEFPELILVKTAGYFMNESGGVIREFYKNSPNPVENFYLAHDDLDIKLGEYKIQFGTGPKVHNGVESVENALGTKEFWRVRIGIDNREPSYAKASEGREYVLQRFTKEEREVLDKVLEKIANEITQTNS